MNGTSVIEDDIWGWCHWLLGVDVDYKDDGTSHLTQPHLRESILCDLRLAAPGTATKLTPAAITVPLKSFERVEDLFDNHFHYRLVVGNLNYLENSTRPDISYTIHQCVQFCVKPKAALGRAVRHVRWYLYEMKTKGIILWPDKSETFEVFADADFLGKYNKLTYPTTIWHDWW